MSNYQVTSNPNVGTVDSIVAGSNIAVDSTDPENPIVSVQGNPIFTGVVDTTNNTLDDGSGNSIFLGSVTSNGFGSSAQITLSKDVLDNSEILMYNANFAIGSISFENTSETFFHSHGISILSGNPPPVFGGGQIAAQIYSSVSGITGLSVPIYQDEAGNNYPWGVSPSGLTLNKQVFSASGTYTPTTGLSYAYVEVIGGGGGGGGVANQGIPNNSASGGGGYGEYASGFVSAATIGASQVITVGTAGAGGAAGNNPGGNGGTSSFGAIITAVGATGGNGAGVGDPVVTGGAGGTGGSGGSLRFKGASGGSSFSIKLTGLQVSISGVGASGIYGAGGQEVNGNTVSGANGNTATGYGAGGSGGASQYQGGAQSGGAGSAGIVMITEYIQT